jgi:hypothetical protein
LDRQLFLITLKLIDFSAKFGHSKGTKRNFRPMPLRAHHLALTLFAGAIALGSLAVLTVNSPTAQAACQAGSSVVIANPSSGVSGGANSGIINLMAYSTPTTASSLSFALFKTTATTTQVPIGVATLTGSQWVLGWDSRNQPNGSYQLMAIAHFGTATSLDCASQTISININNPATQAPILSGVISPNNWQGALGSSAPFALDTMYTDQYGRQSHVSPLSVNWHSTLGAALPNGGSTTVFTAAAVGTGTLMAEFTYNGLAASVSAPVKISSATTNSGGSNPTPKPAPTPSPVPGTTASNSGPSFPTPTPVPVSAADATRLAAMPTIFRPVAPTNSDPVVNIPTLSCLELALGKVRFSEISTGHSQPTAAERKLAASCFSGAEAIPSVLAPVSPANLTDLVSTSDIVSLTSINNHSTTSKDGKSVKGLLLTGKGSPNSSIFIYVFSDPLVLRAETDSQGAWKYVLETPLKDGKHEVYAVAEKDAGNFVRTSAVPITIAAAAPGSQDGSLVVEGKWSTAQIGFAGGALILVLAGIGVLFSILRRRNSAPAAPAESVHSSSNAASAPGPMPGLIQPTVSATTPPVAVPAPPAPPVAPVSASPVEAPASTPPVSNPFAPTPAPAPVAPPEPASSDTQV